jgi:hypothetical protein
MICLGVSMTTKDVSPELVDPWLFYYQHQQWQPTA